MYCQMCFKYWERGLYTKNIDVDLPIAKHLIVQWDVEEKAVRVWWVWSASWLCKWSIWLGAVCKYQLEERFIHVLNLEINNPCSSRFINKTSGMLLGIKVACMAMLKMTEEYFALENSAPGSPKHLKSVSHFLIFASSSFPTNDSAT